MELLKSQSKGEEKTEDTNLMNSYRRFFSKLKSIRNEHVNTYIFITGVSPQALNDFTSGFNIGMNIGESRKYADILGYPEQFVMEGLELLKIPSKFKNDVFLKLKNDNNGYRYVYDSNIEPIFNPSKINYCFKRFQERLAKYHSENQNMESPTDFLENIFRFPDDANTRPAESVLKFLSGIKTSKDLILKILLKSQRYVLGISLRGPSLSYWNFSEDHQILSFLFYFGALTYAPCEPNHKCILKIPNKIAELEYFLELRERINQSDQDNIRSCLNSFFQTDDIIPLLKELEKFFKCYAKPADITQSKEDGIDWSIFLVLKAILENQVERQVPVKMGDKIGWIDLNINPDKYKNKTILLEEKNIPFNNMKDGLKIVYQKRNQQEICEELNEKDWIKLNLTYKNKN